jgi:hypothetical protein
MEFQPKNMPCRETSGAAGLAGSQFSSAPKEHGRAEVLFRLYVAGLRIGTTLVSLTVLACYVSTTQLISCTGR